MGPTPTEERGPVTRSFHIAGAAGFWGDRNDALRAQVTSGPIDAVMLDYLAEITMSILRRQLDRDPRAGYARDFLKALQPALPTICDRGIQVVTNAGGMNPRACAEAVAELARAQGARGLKVGLVTGDDIFDQLDTLAAGGVTFSHLDTGAPLATVRERLESANLYLGADPIAEALRAGAQIVVTGRTTDSALVLGPLLARFGWAADNWDNKAAGIVAGHLLECGGQGSGGNFAGGWRSVPDLAHLGYPIAEVEPSGQFVVTKHAALGGLVTPAVLKEQLLYEIGDPRAYLTPDVTADFTSIRLEDLGKNRVRVFGVRGRPPPDSFKASLSYRDGWRSVATLTFIWPHAVERAQAAADLLLERCRLAGIQIDAHQVDLIGAGGALGPMAAPLAGDPPEVLLRVAIRTRDEDSARRFGREVAPLITSGLPGACSGPGFGGRPEANPIINFWPALVPQDAATCTVEVIEA